MCVYNNHEIYHDTQWGKMREKKGGSPGQKLPRNVMWPANRPQSQSQNWFVSQKFSSKTEFVGQRLKNNTPADF